MSIRDYFSTLRRSRSVRPNAIVRSLTTPYGKLDVRTAVMDDVSSIMPMVEDSCRLHENWDSAKFGLNQGAIAHYRRWLMNLAEDPNAILLVSAMADQYIGYLVATIDFAVPIYQPSKYGYVRDLWVREQFRSAGLGKAMLGTCLDRFKELGISQVRLETASANEAARMFFARSGFRACATEMLTGL